MATSATDLDRGATFASLDPATGEIVGTHPVHTAAEVSAAVVRARAAAAWWRDLGFDGRRRRLQAFKSVIARRGDEICALIRAENGKPLGDAFIELTLAVDHLDWAARNAERIMRRRRVPSTLNLLNQAASVEYLPVGVVGVIGPWNYPLHTPMGSISYALAAGNAVVFKPSEYTPGVGEWLARQFQAVVEEPVLQVVTGYGDTGNALCDAPVDVLAFTGSARTGRAVMAACAAHLTKVVMECGGKDAMIVDAGADLAAAATAAVWGGCANGGQTCAGVERVYVVDAVYDEFVERVAALARPLRAGDDAAADYGAITMPSQIDVIQRHLMEALAAGARAVVGGPESVRPPFVDPVVLVDVPDDAALLREETFGPILPITRVADADEAVHRANDSDYGLGATVYAARTRGTQLARRLRVGMVSINSVLSYAAVPSLPFGGRGESGYGRIHGADGLKEFTTARAMTRQRFAAPKRLQFARFDRDPRLFPALGKVLKLKHGRN